MSVLSHVCVCGKDVAFVVMQQYEMPRNKHKNKYAVLLKCPSCTDVAYAVVSFRHEGNDAMTYPRDLCFSTEFELHAFAPVVPPIDAPEYVPPHVERQFLQAARNRRANNLEASAIMYRKSLEMAIKLLQNPPSGNLKSQIDRLAMDHRITPAMQEWAHTIRLICNEAAHEAEEPPIEEVDQVHFFTEMFLHYLYTLPAKIELRRQAKQAPPCA